MNHNSNGVAKAQFQKIKVGNIPKELTCRRQWVLWRSEIRNKEPTKVPYDATRVDEVHTPLANKRASASDPKTWAPFPVAYRYWQRNPAVFDGIGLVLRPDDDLIGIDFDKCLGSPEVVEWLQVLNSYTELSPSGNGYRCFVLGEKPGTACRRGGIEIYDNRRFLTVTGNRLEGFPDTIEERSAELTRLYEAVFRHREEVQQQGGCADPVDAADEIVLNLARGQQKFQELWAGDFSNVPTKASGEPDWSSADATFCWSLARFTRSKDQMDRIYRHSPLMRDKWERDDYRQRTIGKALDTVKYEKDIVVRALEDIVDTIVKPVEPALEPKQEPALELKQEPAQEPKQEPAQEPKQEPALEPKQDSLNQERQEPRDHIRIAEEVLGEKLKPASTGYQFKPLSARDFASTKYKLDWLVKRLLIKDQPAIIGGPKKVLKTSLLIDLMLSLGSGTPFLGNFHVYRPIRTVLISGESGGWTIQETALRICAAKGINLADTDTYWDFLLPQLSVEQELDALSKGLAQRKIEVAVIDPLYLCLLSGQGEKNAANLFEMGPLLLKVANACLSVGCTPLLCHHARKSLQSPHDPLDLEDLAFAGIQEFARQWLLINRRASYQPGSGYHALWLSAGGSCGHGGLWGCDVTEGILLEDFTGRAWDIEILSLEQVKERAATQKETQKETHKDEKDFVLEKELLAALDASPVPPSASALRKKLGWDSNKFNRILVRLRTRKIVEVVEGDVKIGNGGTRGGTQIVCRLGT